jgi:hypothetical protein
MSEVELLKFIKEQPLYSDYMAFLKNSKNQNPVGVNSSKLAQFKQPSSKLTMEDKSSCAIILLKKIVD